MADLLREKLSSISDALIDVSRPAYSLRAEVLELKSICEAAGGMTFATQLSDIAAGETKTDSGVAISPTMAAMCVDDFARTVQFIRGLNGALSDLLATASSQPVRLLYAGCGPWAPLALPVLSQHTGEEVKFTFVDIHAVSIHSVERIVESLGFEDRVDAFEIADAANFTIKEKPGVIVVEMLRAALESEPQVTVVANLRVQAPDAVMIPNDVRVDLALVDRAKEFALADEKANRDRIHLGTVFKLDQAAHDPVIVTIPEFDSSRYRPMLLTTVCVYRQYILNDYDSGITCPKELRIDNGEITAGDRIEFVYERGPSPRLRATRIDTQVLVEGLSDANSQH